MPTNLQIEVTVSLGKWQWQVTNFPSDDYSTEILNLSCNDITHGVLASLYLVYVA